MKKIALASLAALALSGCGLMSALLPLPPAPATAANKIVLDEQVALSVEFAYQAAASSIGAFADAGLLTGDKARRAAEIDRKAYRAVLAVRAAYDTGNATSYGAAAVTARAEIAALLALLS